MEAGWFHRPRALADHAGRCVARAHWEEGAGAEALAWVALLMGVSWTQAGTSSLMSPHGSAVFKPRSVRFANVATQCVWKVKVEN